MGQTLSEPITEKETTLGEDSRILYGASSMQGWRITMEDAHTSILRLNERFNTTDPKQLEEELNKKPPKDELHYSFFAVFDGHGGPSVARYSGEHLHWKLLEEEAFKQKDFKKALKAAYLNIDKEMLNEPSIIQNPAGCTAVAALITDDNVLYIANSGDSRAIISTNGEATAITVDHKPNSPIELDRIKNAGGYVECGRVNGNLALSRALGDFEFKQNSDLPAEQQVVTADPDLFERKITEDDEFIVLACDGIWDVLTNQEVVDVVRFGIARDKDLGTIAEDVMNICLAKDRSTFDFGGIGCDNMTIVIAAFLNGKTKEEFYKSIREKVNKEYPDEDYPVIDPYARIKNANGNINQVEEENPTEELIFKF